MLTESGEILEQIRQFKAAAQEAKPFIPVSPFPHEIPLPEPHEDRRKNPR